MFLISLYQFTSEPPIFTISIIHYYKNYYDYDEEIAIIKIKLILNVMKVEELMGSEISPINL
jgi:hypothetical protein